MATQDSKPHLTELSKNNNLPSESELQEAFELRSKSLEVLLQIDTEIQRLLEKRAGVQKSIDKYNAILSPARRLLPDVIREIFYHCLPTVRNPTLSATEAPMLLTRVCSIWRTIALTSPQIWASLHIALPGNPTLSSTFGMLSDDALAKRHQVFSKVMELRCRAVKDWLTRSGTCPLSISVSHPLGYVEITDDPNSGNLREVHDVTEPLFRLIVSFSPRWKLIDLTMPFSIYEKLESQISKDLLPLLQSFRGNFNWNDIENIKVHLPTRFLEAPNLQKLSLNTSCSLNEIAMFPLMWGRLIDLRIQSIPEDQFFNIIQLCHNLVTCQINDIQEVWGNFIRLHTEVIVPNLEMMKIKESGGVSHVFQVINAPCLKSLNYRCPPRFDGYNPDSSQPSLMRADALLSLVENGASTLRKLTLEPQYLRPEDIVTCLRLAKQVSHLVLNITPHYISTVEEDILSEDFFDLNLFAIQDKSESQNNLLPKLEVLEVNGIRQFTDEGILWLLTNRMAAAWRGDVSPLRRLKLQISRQMQRDIREEAFARAKAAGFEVQLELDYPPTHPPYRGRLSPSFSFPAWNSPDEIWPPVFDFLDG
jgi:hypothetical protein